MIPTKSCQSGGLPLPFAKAMAIIAAASITHDKGFHIKPKNFKNLLSFFSSNLFGPNTWSLLAPSSDVRPCLEHFSCSNTSSIGILSYILTRFHFNVYYFCPNVAYIKEKCIMEKL
jgi:hypothetical protein